MVVNKLTGFIEKYAVKAKRENWKELPLDEQWVVGFLVQKNEGSYEWNGFVETEKPAVITKFSGGGVEWCLVDIDTICRPTGLTNRKGQIIYENDIIKYHDYFKLECRAKVVFVDGCFTLDWQPGRGADLRTDIGFWCKERKRKIAVIGNMLDNPEMMEEYV